MRTDKQFGWGKTLVYSFIPLLVLVVLAEGGARLWEISHPPLPVDIGLSFDADSRLFVESETRPGWMVTDPNKAAPVGKEPGMPDFVQVLLPTQPFPRQWIEKEKPDDVFRVFVLGGSSVNIAKPQLEQMAKDLTDRFEGQPRIDLINCGGSSYGSHRLVKIAMEVLEFDPDAILVYTGHNEFGEREQLKVANLGTLQLQRIMWQSAALRLVRDTFARDRIQREIEAHEERLKQGGVNHWHLEDENIALVDVDEEMSRFRENLSTIAAACRKRGVPMIIGTVPSNLMMPQLYSPYFEEFKESIDPLYRDGHFEAASAWVKDTLSRLPRGQSSPVENQIIREVAQQEGVFLADVYKTIVEAEPHGVPGETLFVDHCHLSPEGNEMLAEDFAEQLAPIISTGR